MRGARSLAEYDGRRSGALNFRLGRTEAEAHERGGTDRGAGARALEEARRDAGSYRPAGPGAVPGALRPRPRRGLGGLGRRGGQVREGGEVSQSFFASMWAHQPHLPVLKKTSRSSKGGTEPQIAQRHPSDSALIFQFSSRTWIMCFSYPIGNLVWFIWERHNRALSPRRSGQKHVAKE